MDNRETFLTGAAWYDWFERTQEAQKAEPYGFVCMRCDQVKPVADFAGVDSEGAHVCFGCSSIATHKAVMERMAKQDKAIAPFRRVKHNSFSDQNYRVEVWDQGGNLIESAFYRKQADAMKACREYTHDASAVTIYFHSYKPMCRKGVYSRNIIWERDSNQKMHKAVY